MLKALEAASLYIKPEKCIFYTQEVEFLGYIITLNTIRIDLYKLEAISGWLIPSTIKEI